MAYNYVTVTGSFPGATGSVVFTPPSVTDLTGTIPVLGPGSYTYQLSGGSFTTAPLLATDNAGLLPESWSWLVAVQLTGSPAYSYSVLLPHSPPTVNLSALPVSAAAAITSASGGGGATLTRATVLTASGSASANTIVPVSTASSAVAVTLPSAPAAGTVIAVKCIAFGAGNNVTISAAGSDVFNKTGGGTSLTLSAVNQGVYLCYDATTAIWTDLADDLPLSYLDTLFLQVTNNLSDLASPQTALNNIAGAVTSGEFLRGNGTNVQMSAIQPADLPLGGRYLCAPASYAPAAAQTLSTTSATYSAITGSSSTVAAGSNGGEISQIATWGGTYGGNGVLAVASGTVFPAAGGTINVAASGSTTAVVTYTGVSGNTLTGCAYVSGSATGTVSTGGTVTLTTAAASTGSFIAPASGSVVVNACLVGKPSGASAFGFALAAHGTVTPIVANEYVFALSAIYYPLPLMFPVTGLTPGNSYNFDLLYGIASSETLAVYALAQSGTTVTGAIGGPITMTVSAV
jgi:hypothetical protein